MLSCSTEKNTLVNRGYHNMTAHYNVYFNGNEAMKEGLYKIETKVEEDYTKILPIFKESLPGTETMVTTDMNTAIEKATKLIKMHSITKQPEANRRKKNVRKRKPVKPEYVKWVDDAYIMMGKAYLYQKDYIRAASTFTLIIRKYKDEPVKYEAYLWLIRTYSEAERFTEAREMIETLSGNDQFPEKLEGELAILAAEMNLKQQHYEEAIQYLSIGIKKIKGNARKTRYTFILAQLYQELDNKEKALEAYHQVIRRRPDYKMLFNARINSASVYSGESNVATLRKELIKMSKKKRNEPFLDQIYFALGNILYNEGKIDDAVDYYKKSVSGSVENTHQRALSCITLGEIYFDKKKYISSGNYYDSAMVVIDENYPNYKAIATKNESLSKLVNNLVTVQTQDSLQYLAGLSAEELDAKIDKWITVEQKRIEKMQAAGAEGDYGSAYGRSTSSRMRINNQGSSWYFYNPSTVAYGKKEFKRLWGDRKNEDNWRRSDKSISSFDDQGEEVTENLDETLEKELQVRADDPTTKEYYLQDIPNNDSLMAVSNMKIRDALFNAGNLFKSDFNDYERSIECFLALNKRFPNNIYELPSDFNLWDLYKIITKPDSSNYYRNLILNNFPESNYAKFLINPNFFIEEEARKDSLNRLYNLAFNAYQNRDFNRAYQLSKQVMTMHPDTALIPKIRFIQVVSGSRGFEHKRFADSLQAYIDVYPQAVTTPLAQKIFDLVHEDKLSDYKQLVNTGYLNEVIKNLELLPQNDSTSNALDAKWDANSDLLHYFIIAFPNNDEIDVNRLKFDIANYNLDHYTTLDFDIETENLNNNTKLIVVRNFEDKETALIYFLSIIRKPEVFKTLAGQKFLNFIISNNNYREMISDHSYDDYLKFFVKNYSIYTTGKFPDEDLDRPEDLIARLKKENGDQLVEKGEFVLVDTDDGNYQAPKPEEQIFTLDYAAPHSYMVIIDEPRFRTGFLMRDFVRYNSANHRGIRLRVVPGNLINSTFLLVSSFKNAYEANQYLKLVGENKTLFQSLGQTTFSSYVISDKNLNKLRETNDIKAWKQFYQANFVYRKPPAPNEEKPTSSEAVKDENTQLNVEQKTVNEEAKQQEKVTEETKAPETHTNNELKNTNTESNKSEVNDTLEKVIEPQPEVVEDVISSPYVFAPEEQHNLIYLLPKSGSNASLLITYMGRLNALKYRGSAIEITTEDFDDIRSIVVISGIGNSDKAKAYLDNVNADSRIKMSLRNVNYKSYLISNTNLETFRQSKDIAEYEKFYSNHY